MGTGTWPLAATLEARGHGCLLPGAGDGWSCFGAFTQWFSDFPLHVLQHTGVIPWLKDTTQLPSRS
jgi:hypothetical protein